VYFLQENTWRSRKIIFQIIVVLSVKTTSAMIKRNKKVSDKKPKP